MVIVCIVSEKARSFFIRITCTFFFFSCPCTVLMILIKINAFKNAEKQSNTYGGHLKQVKYWAVLHFTVRKNYTFYTYALFALVHAAFLNKSTTRGTCFANHQEFQAECYQPSVFTGFPDLHYKELREEKNCSLLIQCTVESFSLLPLCSL